MENAWSVNFLSIVITPTDISSRFMLIINKRILTVHDRMLHIMQ